VITYEKKGKSKHIIQIRPRWGSWDVSNARDWCTEIFGIGGRNKKYRWRYGWTDKQCTFYFKDEKDATMFYMRWS